jgi:hypothetical protein
MLLPAATALPPPREAGWPDFYYALKKFILQAANRAFNRPANDCSKNYGVLLT